MKSIIVGTSCPARIQLLEILKWNAQFIESDYDKSTIFDEFDPGVLCRDLAIKKIHSVVEKAEEQGLPENFIVTTSRIVTTTAGAILERPRTPEQMKAQMTFRDRQFRVYSGVCVYNRELLSMQVEKSETLVSLPVLNESTIAQLTDGGAGFHYLDAFALRLPPFQTHPVSPHVDATCLLGFPTNVVYSLLCKSGYEPEQMQEVDFQIKAN